jgi:hypothetical protein
MKFFGRKLIVLTNVEQIQLQNWIAETANIAANSASRKIRDKPPNTEVVEVKSGMLGWDATSSGGKITISRDCLSAPVVIRRYLIAHELGHEEGKHPWITVGAAMCMFLPILVCAAPKGWIPSVSSLPLPLKIALAIAFVIGIVGIGLYRFSMLFEWNADKRAARMIGTAGMIQGATSVQQKRVDSTKFYNNKISKLSGGSPSMWRA